MAKFVIKKDGTDEPFDIEKLRNSIRINAIDATLSEAEGKINNLVEEVSAAIIKLLEDEEKITTTELKEKILSELDKVAPNVSETWRKFDQEQEKH